MNTSNDAIVLTQHANPHTRGTENTNFQTSMDGSKTQENWEKQGSNVPEDEEGSDQGEVMNEDDVLEEIEDDPSPENGWHRIMLAIYTACVLF